MTPDQITDIIRQTLYTALQVSSPILLIAMIIGFTISVFQSVTQINEMTLTFVPKIIIFAFVVSIAFPWILKTVSKFALDILVNEWDKISQLANYTQ